jgi:hypothetical protein
MAFNYESKWNYDAPQQRLSNISDALLRNLENNREKVCLSNVTCTYMQLTVHQNRPLTDP